MTQDFLTFGIPFDASRAASVDAFLEPYGQRLLSGGDLRAVLRRQGLHFMTITVVPGDPGKPAHLLLELSVDQGDAVAKRVLDDRLAAELRLILAEAGHRPTGSIWTFLERHRIRTGVGLFDTPGLPFCGTPGMSVDRILDEAVLVRRMRDLLDQGDLPRGTALDRLKALRDRVFAADLPEKLRPLQQPEPVPALPAASGLGGGIAGLLPIGLKALWVLLWPVLLALGLLVVAATWFAGHSGWVAGATGLVAAAVVALVLLVGVVLYLYTSLRALETANQPDDSLPDQTVLADVVAHENRTAQNHLAGISVMQKGWVRGLTLRLAFLVIGELAVRSFRPGFLGNIGTIHFARWVRLPGTDRLLFFSNYGGSWESYLEDFITKAANGLTGVWSNTQGFPRAENVFQKGATDGDRFKRWARRQQRPTRFWYSAYPHLTTTRIRGNAALRLGLLTASTEDEAEAFFSLIGSAPRPEQQIEAAEVQSMFFGGFGKHPEAATVLCALPAAPADAASFLSRILPRVRFGDEAPRGTVLQLGLAASTLERLGVPPETLEQFGLAFRQGMAHPVRANLLADTGDDAPATWLWGNDPSPDAVVNLYARTASDLDAALATLDSDLAPGGGRRLHTLRMQAPQASPDGRMREAFGFADGISQPVVRGTRRWSREQDRIHTAEPGEFLYGYPDNRGYLPPSPTLRASSDPMNLLAVAEPRHTAGRLMPDFSATGANQARDFGRNGSFLVVRHLEQDVVAFNGFLDRASQALEGKPGVPPGLTHEQRAEWIGAKMVGRWKDGTSLVRYPSAPGTGWDGRKPEVPPDNDFLLGAEDPTGVRCPFGSHVRRTNPRDSFEPGSAEQLAIVNRHRILRRGRNLEAAGSGDPACRNPALLFQCLNLDLERQFEFIQQTWCMALQFHGLDNEVDAILSRGGRSARLTIPTGEGPLTVRRIRDFVRVRGGGYFFLPGRRTLRWLAAQAA